MTPLDIGEAAAYLRLSTRQVHRLLDRYRADGAAGLVHGNRGRAPAGEEFRERLVELAMTYAALRRAHG